MSQPHSDTRALITGGSQGLGLACAQSLIAQGCRQIVITGRDGTKGVAAVGQLAEMGAEAHFIAVDMGDIPAVQDMVDRAAACIGDVNALVNSAANTGRGSVLDTSPEQWDAILTPNAKGAFFAMQAFANRAIAQGHGGGIVNILSMVVHGGLPFLAPYVASKCALLGLTKNAAATLARHRIRVNGINVGWMDTPGENETQKAFHGRDEGWQAEAGANLPFGQLLQAEHVASQVALFLSPASGIATGAIIDFDQQVAGAYPDTDAH